MYNLIHNVKLPTAGYSDHLAQILHIKTDNPKPRPVIVRKRQFTEKSLAIAA